MSAVTSSPVLVDLVPGARARDAIAVVTGTAFLAVAAQIVIPLPFTPIPISLATFAVLLTGAALGPIRAGASVAMYLLIGMAGAPFFANQGSGWAFASFGYVLGYLPAALLVGYFARRRADRSVLWTVGVAMLGSAMIYAFGLPWLMGFLDVDLATGLRLGVTPFLAGDAIKAAAAALLLPSTWALVRSFTGGESAAGQKDDSDGATD